MKKFSRRSILPLFGAGATLPLFISSTAKRKSNASPQLPPALKQGDLVGVCAPAGGIKNQQEPEEFKSLLEEQGYRVKLGKNVFGRYGYFSASDVLRAEEFMEMVIDPEVKAVFFIRGGWGCARILPLLDFDLIAKHPKVYMGFSDITSLLNTITARTGLITFHGPNGNASWNERSLSYFRSMITDFGACAFRNLPEDLVPRTLVEGVSQGILMGGNLSVINAMLGTPFEPDLNNKILFLEEVKEEPYRIDRMLTQMVQHGIFKGLNGLVLGAFRDCVPEEKDRAFTVDEVFDHHLKSLGIPVYANAQFGHVLHKFILPIGAKMELDSRNCSMKLLEKVVIH
jgi:muramoyltetrapeptide carboxypeptidase